MGPPQVPNPPAAKPADLDPGNVMTTLTGSLQTVGGSDVVFATANAFPQYASGSQPAYARRIYPNSSGALAIKRVNDTAFVIYQAFAGQYIDGQIQAVGGTGSGSASNLTWIPEI